MAQRPRIGPHIEAMRENIAEVLGIGKSRINIKATTTERLGFVGREREEHRGRSHLFDIQITRQKNRRRRLTMKLSKMHLKTLREVPNEAEIPSHVLLLRAGMIRQLVSGVYGFMPLGWRSVRKIEDIVRQEMDAAGGQEIHMSAVQPAELWQESGRWNAYGPNFGD